MILRFKNLEVAALAAAKLRHAGHYAELCDDGVALLWGPVAVGGVRVIASDAPVEVLLNAPSPSRVHEAFFGLARLLVAGLSMIAVTSISLSVLQSALLNPVGLMIFVMSALAAMFACAAFSMAAHRFLSDSILRQDQRRWARTIFLTCVTAVLVVAAA